MKRSKRAVLVRLGALAPSSRVRVNSIVEPLAREGWNVRVIDGNKGILPWPIRLLSAIRPGAFVFVQKFTPPSGFSRLLGLGRVRLVYDVDDAVYLGYPGETGRSATMRRRRVQAMCRAAVVVSTTSYLIAEDLRELEPSCRPMVFPGPSPQLRSSPRISDVRIIWLGSPSSVHYLSPILPLLRSDNACWRDVLIVGGRSEASMEGRIQWIPWSECAEAHALTSCSVGIMPISEDLWSTRKAAYKVLEYLANGVYPVVPASPSVHAALGTSSSDLVGYVEGDTAADWARSLERIAQERPWEDETWRTRVTEYLESISPDRFANALVTRWESV